MDYDYDYGKLAIILGIIWMIVAFGFLLATPLLINYDAKQFDEKILFAHSDHLQGLKTQLNFVTHENDQHLWMFYSITSSEKKSGFISLILPYEGELISGEGWQSKKINSGPTILFKNFTCTEESCPSNSGYVTFNFLNNIESFRSPSQYIQLPFSTHPQDNEIKEYIAKLKPEGTETQFGWRNVDVEVTVIFDDEFDDWLAQPTSKIKSFIRQNDKTNIILSWNLEDDDSLFTAKYTRELDRSSADFQQTFAGVGLGAGVSLIVAGVALTKSEEGQSILKRFIKVERHLQDANTAYTNKDYDLAKKFYDKAIKADPKNIEAYIQAGNSFYKRKRYDDAIPYYEKIIDDIDPTNVTALANLGVCNIFLKNNEKALEFFEKALEFDHNHVDSLLGMGTSILNLGLLDFAEPYFDEILKIDKKDELAIANKGRILYLAGQDEQAIKFFDKALRIKPDSLEALQLKALSLFRLKRHEEAIACYNLILIKEPLDMKSRVNKAGSLIEIERFDEALVCCDEVLITLPNDVTTLNNKIACLLGLKKIGEAKELQKKLDLLENKEKPNHDNN